MIGKLLKRLFSNHRSAQAVTSMAEPSEERRTDPDAQEKIAAARELFRDGPLGKWQTSNDCWGTGLYGAFLEFRADGTGTFRSWGLMVKHEWSQKEFRWRSVGFRQIAIVVNDTIGWSDDDPEVITYDFFMLLGYDEVYLLQVDPPLMPGDVGFWWAYGPVTRLPD